MRGQRGLVKIQALGSERRGERGKRAKRGAIKNNSAFLNPRAKERKIKKNGGEGEKDTCCSPVPASDGIARARRPTVFKTKKKAARHSRIASVRRGRLNTNGADEERTLNE